MMLMNLCLKQENQSVHTDLQPARCQHTSVLYYVVNLGAQEAPKTPTHHVLLLRYTLTAYDTTSVQPKLLYELATPAETI